MNYNEAIKVINSHYPDMRYTMLREALDLAINLMQGINGKTSDGYHTFDELYHHRMILFCVICNNNLEKAWKSKLHHDGTMYENYFIVGITTVEGDYTYHYHMDCWNYFNVNELLNAPDWDGHKPEDITRLLSLYDNHESDCSQHNEPAYPIEECKCGLNHLYRQLSTKNNGVDDCTELIQKIISN